MIELPLTLFLGALMLALALGALIAAWACEPVAQENRESREKPKRYWGVNGRGLSRPSIVWTKRGS